MKFVFIFIYCLLILACIKDDDKKVVQSEKTDPKIDQKKELKKNRIDSIKEARKAIFAKIHPPTGELKNKKFNQLVKAIFKTNFGEMEFELFPKYAPIAVENFINLAKVGFYKNNQFFRVIEGFVVQAGDPSNTGTGTAGYYFESERNIQLSHDRIGMLSYANFDRKTNSSQFFITLSGQTHLDANHPIFGKILKGVDVLKKIGSVQTGENDKPVKPVIIDDIIIIGL